MGEKVKKIMVVDDEIGIRDVLYNLFTSKGYEVVTAENGKRALEILKNTRPDLIIIDYRMPQMTGLETLKKIRGFDEKIRVVMLTAFGTPEVQKEALKLGVDDFLNKDMSTAEFIKHAEEVINRLSKPVKPVAAPAKIMVVDDEPGVRDLLKDFFTMRGHNVLPVSSGEEAIAKVELWNPDIILLDIKMPGMDGMMCLKKIKEIKPEVGVVVMTGEESVEIAREAVALGAYEFVMKPFNLEYLDTVILSKIILQP